MKAHLHKHSLVLPRRVAFAVRLSFATGALLLPSATSHAATVFVKTPADSGAGSLRAALTFANAHPGTTVAFAIPRAALQRGVAVIRPVQPLPVVRANGTRIDGTSQARFVGDTNPMGPEIVLNGARQSSGERSVGLRLQASQCRVSALVIQGFGSTGMVVGGPKSTGNHVTGCYIGTDASGQKAVPNGRGVVVGLGAHDNVIGGIKRGEGNTISGNDRSGVALTGAGVTRNRIEGCLIGTDRWGQSKIPNHVNGIVLSDGAFDNQVGGTAPGARNVVSGNGWDGILVVDFPTRGNRIQGNFIGLDSSGTRELGNDSAGVSLATSSFNLIGGAAPGARNVVSGNKAGINLIYEARNNVVQGNFVGTNLRGDSAVPNKSGGGVVVRAGSTANIIGGTAPGAGNLISGNADGGLWIGEEGTRDNVAQGNLIGLTADGSAPLPNKLHGIGLYLGAQETRIGGTEKGAGNTIAANGVQGIDIVSAATANNVVQGNVIGWNASKTVRFVNGERGIRISDGAHDNTIGGTSPGQANIIASRMGAISIVEDGGEHGNRTEGNVVDRTVVGHWVKGQTANSFAPLDWDVTKALREIVSAPTPQTQGDAGTATANTAENKIPLVVRLQYTGGNDRLDSEWVELLENGKSLARDTHMGRTGNENVDNEYTLTLPALTPGATYTLRASVLSGGDSSGEVQLGRGTATGANKETTSETKAEANLEARLQSADNVARTATVLPSSLAGGQGGEAAVDGVVSGYPEKPGAEWATLGEKEGATLRLEWKTPQTIDRVQLFDRPNGDDNITKGQLTFSDGSTVEVGAVAPDGTEVTFPAKTVTWLSFKVTGVSPGTQNVGLAEIAVYRAGSTPSKAPVTIPPIN